MLGLSGKATALSRSFQRRAASPRQPALCPAEEQRLAKPGRGHIQIERHEVWLELVMSGHGRKCGGYHGMCLTRMVRECEGLRRLAGSRGAWERVKDYCRLVTGQCITIWPLRLAVSALAPMLTAIVLDQPTFKLILTTQSPVHMPFKTLPRKEARWKYSCRSEGMSSGSHHVSKLSPRELAF
jgi:hypothetical protein